MEQIQKFTFASKNSKNVASLPDQDFPDTVLLFEPRISHPALRVTLTKELFKLSDYGGFSLKFSMKFTKNQFFFFFQIFFKNLRSFVRILDLDKSIDPKKCFA